MSLKEKRVKGEKKKGRKPKRREKIKKNKTVNRGPESKTQTITIGSILKDFAPSKTTYGSIECFQPFYTPSKPNRVPYHALEHKVL